MDPHKHGTAVLEDLIPIGRELRKMIPDVYKKFAELDAAALSGGAVTPKPNSSSLSPSALLDSVMAALPHTPRKLPVPEQPMKRLQRLLGWRS